MSLEEFKIGDHVLFKYNYKVILFRIMHEDKSTYYVDIIYSEYDVIYKTKTDKGFPLFKDINLNISLASQEIINYYSKLATFQ